MFQQVRQGNQLYILHKGEQPRIEVTTVTHAGQPTPKFQTQYNPYLPAPNQEMLVDITVKIGEQVLDFGGLPAAADFVDLTSSGKPMILATSREAMMAQVENMLAGSKQIVESVDYHRSVMQGCEAILQQLNPQLAERKQQDQRMEQMNKEMGNVKSELGELKSMLARFLNQNTNRNENGQKQMSASNPKNN